MKMVKSLLLGTAAGLVAMTGAQAADLPVKAKPVQYVKICSLYGAGFYYIPGTDTCIKIGGWVRAEYNMNAGGSFNPIKLGSVEPATFGAFTRNSQQNTIRARAMITLDARSQTEYGTLRSYIASGWNTTTGTSGTVFINGQTGSRVTSDQDALYVPRAFIQLGGFTWGKAQSFFDFYSTPAYSNTTNVWGSDTGGGGQIVAGYTAQLGNGLSATLSLEDPLTRRTTINALPNAVSGAPGGYANGVDLPDLVANLNVSQAWGSAQVMGALHQVNSQYYTVGVPGSGHPADAWGWAVGGGLKINLPMLGKGDNISAQVGYTEGALKYAGGGIGNFNVGSGGFSGAFRGQTHATDALYGTAPNTSLQLTKAWSVVAGYSHGWNAQWKTSLYGTYGKVQFGSLAATVLTAPDADWAYSQVGSRTVWTPVANLDLSVDVMYNKLNTAYKSAGRTDQSWWQGIIRAQRNFWP